MVRFAVIPPSLNMLDRTSLTLTGAPAVACLLLYRGLRKSQRPPLPPGPKGTFILGNALQMPKENNWLTYSEWAKQWGTCR
jgi:hypothetical protein